MSDLTEIQKFNNNLPDWVYHRSRKNIAPIVSPKEKAIQDKYIAPFHQKYRNYIAVDVDHENWYEKTDDINLLPNIVIQNKDNGKAHLLFKIKPIWLGDGASRRLKHYHSNVQKGLTSALGGDLCFNNQTIKNPNNNSWNTHELTSNTYELSDIAQDIVLPNIWDYSLIEDDEGRNTTMFNALRFYAYKEVYNNHKCSKSLEFMVRQLAYELYDPIIAQFKDKGKPYRISEVECTIRSVVKYTWEKYTNGESFTKQRENIDIGRDEKIILDNDVSSKKDRQKLSAEITNKNQKIDSEHKIKIAVIELTKDKKNINLSSVSRQSGLARTTVRRHYEVSPELFIKPELKEDLYQQWITKKREEYELDTFIEHTKYLQN